MLDIEVTVIKINNKSQYLVRLGSFEDSLANKTANFIWKNRVCPPNLRIYRLSREFAAAVGRMGLLLDDDGLDKVDDGDNNFSELDHDDLDHDALRSSFG